MGAVDSLLEAGADANQCTDVLFYIFISFAYQHNYQKGNSVLHLAAQIGNTSVMKSLLKGGADVNKLNPVFIVFRC